MNKLFCDCCGKEMKPTEMFGAIMRLKRQFSLGASANSQLTIDKEAWDLCEDCQIHIWNTAEVLKEDVDKKR